MSENVKPKRETRRIIKVVIEVIFFVALLVFAFFYILKDDPAKTFSLLSSAKFFPILISIVIIIISLLLDSISITVLSHFYNKKYTLMQGIVNTCSGQILGVFVKSASSVFQAITFTKQEISKTQSASILSMNYILYQVSLLIYSTIILLVGYPIIKDVNISLFNNVSLFTICLICVCVQFAILAGLFSLTSLRSVHRFVLNNCVNILSSLHILKNKEKTRENLTLKFATYRIEMQKLKQNKVKMLIVISLNLLKRFLLDMIPFFIFLSLGVTNNDISFFNSITATGYVDIISSLISVGAPEVSFQSIYTTLLVGVENSSSIASAANLLWRSLTFYLLFIIGLVSLFYYRLLPKREQLFTHKVYNLQIIQDHFKDPKFKKYLDDVNFKTTSLLSADEVKESFENIRNNINNSSNNIVSEDLDEEVENIISSHRLDFAKLEQDINSQLLKKEKENKQIQEEADNELKRIKEKNEKK